MWRKRSEPLILGVLGVLCFSFTLPATRVSAPILGGTFVGLGRAIIAALLAALILIIRREPLPARRYWWSLVIVALGIIVGFPLFSALALQQLPSVHGAVVIGLLPAATAIMAVLRAGERPPILFWIACGLGVIAVLIFALLQGAGNLQPADGLLLIAVVMGALGYAEGGRLAREIGGWRVICWALILAAPWLILPVAFSLRLPASPVPVKAWIGFGYVSIFSMFLGFFAWYRGLALGGVARIGQLQLAQPVLTLCWSALLLGEHVTWQAIIAALLVIACAALSQFARFTPQRTGKKAIPS